MNATMPNETACSSRGLCHLTHSYSFLLQSVLGVVAFSTLLLKRYREPALQRRPFWIWWADTTKQALGMLEIHFVNLAISTFIKDQECISYLVNFLLDSTMGLLLIFLLLKVVAGLVSWFQITPLFSGEYGTPFKFHYWLGQCAVYLMVMLIEKLIVGPLVTLTFWKKVDKYVLPCEEHLRIAIVIFIVPFVVNVTMFWIVDSILMRKRDQPKTVTSVHYHRRVFRPQYGRLRSEESDVGESSETASEVETEGVRIRTPSPEHRLHIDSGR